MRCARRAPIWLAGLLALCAACSSRASGNHGAAGAGNSDASASGGSAQLVDSDAQPGADSGFGGQCSGTTSSGTPAPLDIYFIVDISGSMLEQVSTGVTKWDAVHQAISDFVNDPASAEIGVGLQYFPVTCSSHGDCDQGGPCSITTCASTGSGTVDPCVTSATCPAGESCYSLGACSTDGSLCVPAGSAAVPNCGTCAAIKVGECWDSTDCNTVHYSTPAVEIAALSANKQQVLASIDGIQPALVVPQYSTPTPAALQGALAHARAYAESHPSHTVVTVLATDGYPNECLAAGTATVNDAIQQVANLASAAFNATPGIRTYVIGVFPPSDANAPILLDTIAQAGKTDHAYVASATTSLSSEFRSALQAIRGRTFSCDYAVPPAPSGQTLDYGKVNVVFNRADAAQRLYYVRDASACDAVTSGGWYYDVDPTAGTPSKIVLCSQSCAALQGSADGSLDIELGCQTVEAPLH